MRGYSVPLLALATTFALQCAGPLAGQERRDAEGSGGPTGVFGGEHSEADLLLDAFDVGYAVLYEQLLTEPDSPVERLEEELYGTLAEQVLPGGAPPSAAPDAVSPTFVRSLPRAAAIFERTNALRRRIYDIYADDGISDKVAAVDGAVAEYLVAGDALAAAPKSMEIMAEEHGTTTFQEKYPRASGLFWAFRWLEVGLYDALMAYSTADERQAGVDEAIERFRAKLADPPERLPTHAPMAPAIAPELVSRHPRAAAIFDNTNLLREALVSILVDEAVVDKSAAVEQVIERFADPDYLALPEIDWIWMALRHGIFAQGGPVIGQMQVSERNDGGHGAHGDDAPVMMMPPSGMP